MAAGLWDHQRMRALQQGRCRSRGDVSREGAGERHVGGSSRRIEDGARWGPDSGRGKGKEIGARRMNSVAG